MSPASALLPAITTPAAALHATWAFLLQGGLFMIPLALCSIIGMMAILYKFHSACCGS